MMSEALSKVLQILDWPASMDAHLYYKQEAQKLLLEFSVEEWAELEQWVPSLPTHIVENLCRSVSPVKHGKAASSLLFFLAQQPYGQCLELATERLLMQQELGAGQKERLSGLLESRIKDLSEGQRLQHLLQLKDKIMAEHRYGSIAEAQEIANCNKELLERCEAAACFFCQTHFELAELGNLEEAENPICCPYCGTEAVLPDNQSFDLSPAGLEALNEFWFG